MKEEDINLSRYNDLKHDIEQLRSDIKTLTGEVRLLMNKHSIKDSIGKRIDDLIDLTDKLETIQIKED